jgi:hypothetical protein
MPSKIRTKISLTAILFAATLAAMPTVAGAQPAAQPSLFQSGKIIGRLLDQGTRKPLAGEVAASFVSTGKIILKHVEATKEGEFVIDGIEAGKVYLTTKLDGATQSSTRASRCARVRRRPWSSPWSSRRSCAEGSATPPAVPSPEPR